MRRFLVLAWTGFLASCGIGEPERTLARLPPPPDSVPLAHQDGAGLYAVHCAVCHGEVGRGSEVGPPLVHPVYRPAHHGDAAFQIAVTRGVRAHHWRHGDMPPVDAVEPEDVERITDYVRWLQREAGIR